ncbi:hypothetical protein J4Q44_G00239620 [Coregonus suidteri]|uniref:Uncharacterized protein n=1 Tax=Coregonus suidteri TaxID=861788 RepID=A0AAN8QXM1_9TELE
MCVRQQRSCLNTANPREFSKHLTSSSCTVRPTFRRYQRSLTDNSFIFRKSEPSTPTSPRSPTMVSPFSQNPTHPRKSASLCPHPDPCLHSLRPPGG